MQRFNVWELIQNGDYETACEIADLEYEKTKSIFPLRNKIFALFHLKRYQQVIQLARQVIEMRNGETDSDFISLGIAYWGSSDVFNAIDVWKQAQHCKYLDSAGGMEVQLYLYFAAIKTRDSDLKLSVIKHIKKILKSKNTAAWPAPIGAFLIDIITKEQLMSSVSKLEILKERQSCQAYFAIAIKFLAADDKTEYNNMLLKSVSSGSYSHIEYVYYLAKAELEDN